MKTKTKTFEITSGRLFLGDPCYETNKTFRAMNGSWTAHVEMTDEGGVWGERVGEVVVHHEQFDPSDPRLTSKTVGFSVDSGQAGVFDSQYSGDGFYDQCCQKTLGKTQCGVLPAGFVSSSGYGDGWYEAKIFSSGGLCVCVELKFIEQ
jgi:hypothetical protein